MKKILSALIFLLSINISNSQNLNLKLLDQLTNIPFSEIDEVMINGYGFYKMETKEKATKMFAKIYDNDVEKIIVIRIIKIDNFPRNALSVNVAKAYSIRKIKDNLVQEGFLYSGSKGGLSIYKKNDILYLIANKPNDVGATQILVTYFSIVTKQND